MTGRPCGAGTVPGPVGGPCRGGSPAKRPEWSVLDVFAKEYKDERRMAGSNSLPAWAR